MTGLEMVERIEALVEAQRRNDAELTEMLVKARQRTPAIPLAVLAKACGMTEAGVSIRVRRATGIAGARGGDSKHRAH